MTLLPASAPVEPVVVPTLTPGTYVRLRREALGLTVEQVAMMLETDPGVSVQRRVEWLVSLERDAEEISDRTALVLHDVIAIDLRMLAYWIAVAEAAKQTAREPGTPTADVAA